VSISVVVPCYRSAATLPALVSRLAAVLAGLRRTYEIILVVDGGPDDTWEIAHDLSVRDRRVRVIRLARNYGQHNALIAGIRAARYGLTVTMDDDLQHPPEQLPRLLEALSDDIDLVYAVPRVEEHGMVRSCASRMVKAGLAGAMGIDNARRIGAFRVFRTFLRAALEHLTGPHVSVDVALSWATTRVAAVAVDLDRRTVGQSGYSTRALMRHATNLVVGYSTAPLRQVTYLGFVIGTGGMVLFARVLWQYFHGDTTVAGFTTLASMIAIFSSAQMIAVGVLGEYVGRVHVHGMGRPTYVIRRDADITADLDAADPAVAPASSGKLLATSAPAGTAPSR
jgi:glycosyltransferase involved in cell wall biosynthesis